MGQTIGLINTYSTLNIGDAAIYSALAAMAPDARIVAQVQDQEPAYVPGVEFVSQLGPCDGYISVGGDIFNNAREGLITRTFIQNLLQLRRSPRQTILFGQSIPRSCHGLSFRALTFCLRRLAAVCVRDAESHQRLIQAGVPAILSFDAAFALEVREGAIATARQMFSSLGVKPEQTALISLRAFDSMYGHDNQKFQDQLIQLSQKLDQQGYQPVLLIQSQAYGADNDLEVAAAITQKVPQVKVFNPFIVNSGLPRWELVMGALYSCGLIVAIRYHTAVLALASGRIPFNLYYSNKGRDLSQRLGIPGCGLDQFNVETALEGILQTGAQTFDHVALRSQVQQAFHQCLQQIGG
uniref:Polysaccharide pyruvyl transferase domain-containing protein n=1 Tax=Cyanothece sp. (strain PCC 7425 / ATCC 29141) TaxID=395961 RepID=B8HJS7_CYAP4